MQLIGALVIKVRQCPEIASADMSLLACRRPPDAHVSIVRSRSGVVLSFVVETSCLIIGKNHNRQPGPQTQCTAFSSSLYPHHARQCRTSGLVLGSRFSLELARVSV